MTVSILIVDDEADVCELFRRRFRSEIKKGIYHLHFAESANNALKLLANEIKPELMLILSDINMPGMSGLELLTKVKSMLPMLPVVMISAYGDAANREHARELGAYQFLTKPVDFEELKNTISAISNRSGANHDA